MHIIQPETARGEVVYNRTYARPLDDGTLERWDQTVDRVIDHQRWLWERAKGAELAPPELAELAKLREYMFSRAALPAGRTLWLGGTDLSKRREVSQFNCAYLNVETVHDVVDAFWLLLNGCGVGFTMKSGTLNGFAKPIEKLEIIRSNQPGSFRGPENNEETWDGETWTIKIGDSGEAWAKAIGKLLAGKYRAKTLVLDFSNIRGAGERLGQYGWISAGDEALAVGMQALFDLLNARAGQLLSKVDILDVLNWCGYIQTGRRGAEIALMDFKDKELDSFVRAKKNYYEGNIQRGQSNNSVMFWNKPSKEALHDLLYIMEDNGGSEPGIYNGEAALKRAPWFQGPNPCGEILLGNKSFCNLVEIDLAKLIDHPHQLEEATRLIARANYRQTCVNLDDGILQRAWHENNEFLHLCGVGITGIAQVLDKATPYTLRTIRNIAVMAANGMADELDLPRPKNVTTIKPSGTVSKVMNTTEGVHVPLGKYIFNNIVFNKHDPLLVKLEEAGYKIMQHPTETSAKVVTFPVCWETVPFDFVDGKYVNLESAIDQLERYKMVMENYVDNNCSITVSYRKEEINDIVNWLDTHWDSYVGVSFLPAVDPTKTAKDLGYPYLPQEVVDAYQYDSYVNSLKSFVLDPIYEASEIDAEDCATGACPIR